MQDRFREVAPDFMFYDIKEIMYFLLKIAKEENWLVRRASALSTLNFAL